MQPTQNPITDAVIPAQADVVRYRECQVCGVEYPHSPSTSPMCGTCAREAESDIDEESPGLTDTAGHYLACGVCGTSYPGPSRFAECKMCTYNDVVPLGYGCATCGPDEYCPDDAIERQWDDYDGDDDYDGEDEPDTNEESPDLTDALPVESVSRILRDTALYLGRHGWIQGAYYDATTGSFTPPACLVGALGMVCYGGPVDAPARNFDDPGWPDFELALAFLDVILALDYGANPGGELYCAYSFNDERGRTVDEVVHALHEAARAWERQAPEGVSSTDLGGAA